MNNVLDTPKSVETIVMCLDLDMTRNLELSKAVLELLTVLCFYHREPSGYQGRDDVFDALCQFYTMKVSLFCLCEIYGHFFTSINFRNNADLKKYQKLSRCPFGVMHQSPDYLDMYFASFIVVIVVNLFLSFCCFFVFVFCLFITTIQPRRTKRHSFTASRPHWPPRMI